jgi:Flp pilus assembly protein TadD
MTEKRVNPETGILEEKGVFGWSPVENPDGHQERINPDTGVREEKGVFGWSPVENPDGHQERTNPDTGAHEEKGVFGWSPTESSNSGSIRSSKGIASSRRQAAANNSTSSDDSGEDSIVKLIVGIAVIVFVIWFIVSVAIPLVVINLASIALLVGIIKKRWSKVLFPVSILGAIIVVADYNLGWATHTLVSNVAFFRSWVKPLLYVNLFAGLMAAYLSIRHVLNTRTPPPAGASELSKRNLIVIGCLLVVGATTIGMQMYADTHAHHSDIVTHSQSQSSPTHSSVAAEARSLTQLHGSQTSAAPSLMSASVDTAGNTTPNTTTAGPKQLIDAVINGNTAAIDSIFNEINMLPKPEHGDRKKARILNNQALAALQRTDFASAVSLLMQANQADPSDAEVKENLSYASMRAGRLTEAEAFALSGLSMAPNRASAWGTIGKIFAKEGHDNQAVASLLLAYKFSRNQAKTVEYLTKVADTDDDARVRATTTDALKRIAAR